MKVYNFKTKPTMALQKSNQDNGGSPESNTFLQPLLRMEQMDE